MVSLLLASLLLLQQGPEGPPPGSAATPSAAARRDEGGTITLEVPGRYDWAETGLFLRRGDTVQVRAWGRVKVVDANGNFANPDGLEGFDDPLRPLRSAPSCALIAVIGDGGNWAAVGREGELIADTDGQLYLGINQLSPEGNVGEFQVRLTVGEKRGLSFGVGTGMLGSVGGPESKAVTNNERVVQVPANLDWTNTSVSVVAGDSVTVECTGTVNLDLAGTPSGPEGIKRADSEKLLADKPTGALVAVIGIDNNDFVFVGSRGTFVATRTGLLFLGVNEGDLTNNSGSFTARVIVSKKSAQ